MVGHMPFADFMFNGYNTAMKIKPSILIVMSFFMVIVIGAFLLSLPISSIKGVPTNFLDAYFTSNSATCVTGLVTLDTGTYFSLFGLIKMAAF